MWDSFKIMTVECIAQNWLIGGSESERMMGLATCEVI